MSRLTALATPLPLSMVRTCPPTPRHTRRQTSNFFFIFEARSLILGSLVYTLRSPPNLIFEQKTKSSDQIPWPWYTFSFLHNKNGDFSWSNDFRLRRPRHSDQKHLGLKKLIFEQKTEKCNPTNRNPVALRRSHTTHFHFCTTRMTEFFPRRFSVKTPPSYRQKYLGPKICLIYEKKAEKVQPDNPDPVALGSTQEIAISAQQE